MSARDDYEAEARNGHHPKKIITRVFAGQNNKPVVLPAEPDSRTQFEEMEFPTLEDALRVMR